MKNIGQNIYRDFKKCIFESWWDSTEDHIGIDVRNSAWSYFGKSFRSSTRIYIRDVLKKKI